MISPQFQRRKLLRQRRSDVALLYHELQEVERGCRAPLVLTPELIAAGVTEDKARRANERRLLDAKQQYEAAVRRVNIMTRCAVRQAHQTRSGIEPQRRRPDCHRPRQRRSHRVVRVTKPAAGDSGDSDGEPPRGIARGPPSRDADLRPRPAVPAIRDATPGPPEVRFRGGLGRRGLHPT
jgi:hypothetical protein